MRITEVDLLFSDVRVKPKKARRIDFSQFEVALELVAEKAGTTISDIRNRMLQLTHPALKGTKVVQKVVKEYDENETHKSMAKAEEERKRKRKRMKDLLAVEGKEEAVDNVNLWKTFGAETQAGRCLKRLYMVRTLPSIHDSGSRFNFKASWPQSKATYVAVNAQGERSFGLPFRRSTNMPDMCTDPRAVVPWGSMVKGEPVTDDWLRVGTRYLPVRINGLQVMQKCSPRSPNSSMMSKSLSSSVMSNALDRSLMSKSFSLPSM